MDANRNRRSPSCDRTTPCQSPSIPSSEPPRLKVWMGIGTVLFCHTKENADYGWHPFSRPLDQILEDMIEKEVKKRVEKEERIRALKKTQDEIGKY